MATNKKKRTSKPIRLSREVHVFLSRHGKQGESFDSILRRHLGIPGIRGQANTLRVYYVVPNGSTPIIRLTEAEARGDAILLAVRKRLGAKKAEGVIEVREVPYVD